MIDFSESASGTPLYGGIYVGNEWDEFGLILSSSGGYGTRPRLFDTSKPGNEDYGDPDLSSPNEHCNPPGPGTGLGGIPGAAGENCHFLGNVLIIQEDNDDTAIPDDNVNGGVITFDFPNIVSKVYEIGLLDIDYAASITVVHETKYRVKETTIHVPILGDNSVQVVPINYRNVRQIRLKVSRSGAVTFFILLHPRISDSTECCHDTNN